MQKPNIGLIHPGKMGISVAASAQNSGYDVYWASEGRSAETQARAAKFALLDAGTLAALCERCEIIISVCPPHAAEDVADAVLEQPFTGLYIDANAISPAWAIRIGDKMRAAGITFVDGSIIGGPAWKPNSTWLYLSGEQAAQVAACFAAGPLETQAIGHEIGQASAIKMCYAAYTKGTAALLAGILAASERLGVREPLETQWSRDWPNFAEQTQGRTRRVTAKAWRFAGEMEEIAATFEAVGLPEGFYLAAADIYRRMAHFKGASSVPELEVVLGALLKGERVGNKSGE